MLALEREQLVSYAYREDILTDRLRGLVAPAEFIEVLRHAFTQVWRDAVGIEVVRSMPVTSIDHDDSGVCGITLATGDHIEADAVISDVGGAAALLDLADATPPPTIRARMAGPLQSPGITAYLRVTGNPPSEINFEVGGDPPQAAAFIAPAKRRRSRWPASVSHHCAPLAPTRRGPGRVRSTPATRRNGGGPLVA